MSADEVIKAAMALPAESKALLAERLLSSLDTAEQQEIDAAWAQEAERRLDAFAAGEIPAVPWSEVRAELKARKH